jgi:2-furoyl-CoA dehydrogenase large subunit
MERKWIGTSMKRREDLRFLTGKGNFIGDFNMIGMLHMAILRSPYAHAKIKKIDTSKLENKKGVFAVLTGDEVVKRTEPFPTAVPVNAPYYCMAVDRIRYKGEPVAAVAAIDRYTAEDAIELIDVEYEPLPAVVDAEEAMKEGAPVLHDGVGNNIGWHREYRYGDVDAAFKEADYIFKERLIFPRFSSTPTETYGCAAKYEPIENKLTIWAGEQNPGMMRPAIAVALRLPLNKVRLIVNDIGGGFGNKVATFPFTTLIGLMAMKTGGRPVKYIEDRIEHNTTSCHGSDRIFDVEFAVKNDGHILGLKVKHIDNFGAYFRAPEPLGAALTFHISWVGTYRIKNVAVDIYAVFTNKSPSGPNRGYGRQPVHFVLERMMDIIAKKLNIDITEIRYKNFIQPDEMPYLTPSGSLYDSGNYPLTLKKALELIDYEGFRKKQKELLKEGKYIGIGITSEVESAASNMAEFQFMDERSLYFGSGQTEACGISMDAFGQVTIAFGAPSPGTSHETVVPQIVADELGIDPENIIYLPGFDSATRPHTVQSGTYASRFAAIGASAVVGAARKLKEKIKRIASHKLEAAIDDIELGDGMVYVKGSPEKGIPINEIAFIANSHTLLLPEDIEPGLNVNHFHQFPTMNMVDDQNRVNLASTYSNGVHISIVEVDPKTGDIKLLRYVVVHDCGFVINPTIVEGQVHGGVAHGIGGGLWEEYLYDENGQMLNPLFGDYIVPKATELIDIEVSHLESPSPFTPLGSKGMGEGGATSSPVNIANAVEDALKPFGVKVTRIPLTPERVLNIIKEGGERCTQ